MRDYNSIYSPHIVNPEAESLFLHPSQIKAPKIRKAGDQNAIIRLAESIKRYGILQPLSVRPCTGGENGMYELISGRRRLQAAVLAGVSRLPCTILPQDDKSCTIAGMLMHLQSGKLHMFEQAASFRMLMADFSLTQEEIARKIGISQSAVANKLRLLQLSRIEQQQILEGGLTERHARALLRLKSEALRAVALRRIIKEKLNVAAAERLIDDLKQPDIAEEQAVEAAHTQATARNALQSVKERADSDFMNKRTHGTPQTTAKNAVVITHAPQTPPEGICPRKFAMKDLRPLYNSIDRTLSIFRKTGATATCTREESGGGVRIIIEIPKHA